MKKNDLLYLDHILQNLSKVVAYTEGTSYDTFLADEEKQDAVIRKIEVCGEATKRISLQIRQRFSHLPWRAMAGMRDKLIHDYFDVDSGYGLENSQDGNPANCNGNSGNHSHIRERGR
ncbi:MAG TPA: DUF86 domain-containing protein [Saprospiraceae bacterium]|nr:DUF86 domain-containing protein [Saprospiraceae bacterium]HMP23034.1 DUF86 domain-containing protein [Saprospiraceae bacterium]